MTDALNLGNVTLAVGQKVEFVITFPTNSPNSFWLVSTGGSVVVPASAAGAPLTWPHEVTLVNGVGSYFILGVSTGVIEYFFRASSDPNNMTNLATAFLTVTVPPAQGQSTGEEIVIEVLSIAEPILITIIAQPPSGTSSG